MFSMVQLHSIPYCLLVFLAVVYAILLVVIKNNKVYGLALSQLLTHTVQSGLFISAPGLLVHALCLVHVKLM